MNSTVVVGLGQPFAGDDGVGPAVVAALGPCPAHVTLWSTSNALDLTDVMQHAQRVVVVDAALDAGPPGTVRVLDEGALMAGETRPVSSHAVGVRDAVMLARSSIPARFSARWCWWWWRWCVQPGSPRTCPSRCGRRWVWRWNGCARCGVRPMADRHACPVQSSQPELTRWSMRAR